MISLDMFTCPVCLYNFKNRGIVNTTEIVENSNPLIDPTAKGNQNLSVGPSDKKGMNPRIVEKTVRKIGIIL